MKKRLLIGVLCAEPQYKRTGEVIEGIIAQAFKCNCDIAVLSPLHNQQFEWNEFRKGEREIYKLAKSDNFDGFLYDRRFLYNKNVEEFIDKILISTKKPVMLIDGFEHNIFDNTAAEDRRPYEKLIEHLIEEHGYKKIYCLTGPSDSSPAVERLNGYFDAMQKHNLYYDENYYIYGDFWKQSAYDLADRIIRREIDKPDAVACGNDVTATALIDALEKGGFRVPEDIAVAGFDYSPSDFNADSTVTSYKRANFQLGADSFRRLYRAITGSVPSRVKRPDEGLVVSHSCGCSSFVRTNAKKLRYKNLTEKLYYDMVNRDIVMEAENTPDIYSAIDVITHYTYCLYRYNNFSIYLKESFLNELTGTDICSSTLDKKDKIKMVMKNYSSGKVEYGDNTFSANSILPDYSSERNYPSAFFISPLNSINRFFGYSAISYGKKICAYDKAYLMLGININNIFEFFRVKASSEHRLSNSSIDFVTGLPYYQNYSEIENKLNEYKELLSIEITDFRTMMLSNSTNEFDSNLRRFADILKSCTTSDDIICVIQHGSFTIIAHKNGYAEKIYDALKGKNGYISPFSFTIGVSEITDNETVRFRQILRHSAMNTVYTFSTRKNNSANDLFEKLCLLNEEMRKAPQNEWNIEKISESMHLSKSYLQKVYKSYFGTGIIENLIQLRMDLAKKLLANTNLTITEIAEKCGYSSYVYFTKQFKKSENVTPSEFRVGLKKTGCDI